MKTYLLIFSFLFSASLIAQPSMEQVKKHRIRKALERRTDASGTVERGWWYDARGYDTLQTYDGSRLPMKNTFKNAKLVEKVFLTENGKKGDSYSYEYKPDGSYKETYTDSRFAMKSYEWYDNKGRMIKSQSPDGNTTTYKYDAKGKLLSVTSDGSNDGVKVNHRYYYNTKAQLIKLDRDTDGNKSQTVYEYDPAGKLVKEIEKGSWEGEAFERTYLYEYNAKGLIQKTVINYKTMSETPVESSETIEFEYEYK